MSPATTTTPIDVGVQRLEPRRETGERALEGGGVVGHADARRASPGRAGRGDDDDLVGDRPDRGDGVVEQRPAVDRLGELVAPEARRPAAREHDRADSGRRS